LKEVETCKVLATLMHLVCGSAMMYGNRYAVSVLLNFWSNVKHQKHQFINIIWH